MPTPDLQALEQRVAKLQLHVESTRRLHRRLGIAAIVVTTLGVGSALAANGNCPNGLPFCFTADEPARASEVNHNFAQLKEWLETKAGPITSNGITTTGASSFMGGLVAAGVTLSGATTISNGASVNGGRLTLNGGLTSSGFQASCSEGDGSSGAMGAPYCCRINVRNGATACRLATNGALVNWVSGNDPFTASSDGFYNLSCYRGISNLNFPGCCRTELNSGTVECRVATNWQLTAWASATNPF